MFRLLWAAQASPGAPGSVTLVSVTNDASTANDAIGIAYQPTGGLTVGGRNAASGR